MIINLEPISKKIADHLTAQKRRSMVRGQCAYRSECDSGAKCAVGHLINDEFYTAALENKTIHTDDVLVAVLESEFGVDAAPAIFESAGIERLRDMLVCWQRYHDFHWSEYSYKVWISDGSEMQSPAALHARLGVMGYFLSEIHV